MDTEQIVKKLINGETVTITDSLQFAQVRSRLREIKNNCEIVLGQLKETLTKD